MALLTVSASAAALRQNIVGPNGSDRFGWEVKSLPNGNYVVTDPWYDLPVADAGAVFLYDGRTHSIISTLTGDRQFDYIGKSGITILPSGHFLVRSSTWRQQAGAITFCHKELGCSGIVSEANSLVGSRSNDQIGAFDPVILGNGDFVLANPSWNQWTGAVTLGRSETGVRGVISVENSLVGIRPGDKVGEPVFRAASGILPLSNGNFVVSGSAWNDNRGAVTFCQGIAGCVGPVSAENSLVGSSPLDSIGDGGVQELSNGNYVVASNFWRTGPETKAATATWGSGQTGVTGSVSSVNSIVGFDSRSLHRVTSSVVTVLANGNFVMLDRNGPGSATLGSGGGETIGRVSAANSLIGTSDEFYLSFVTALRNGNYVVSCPYWGRPGTPNAGAVAFGNGSSGTVGVISALNSLTGSGVNNGTGSGVIALTNGNYVVTTPSYSASRGAITFVDGTTGFVGQVSPANSLVGTSSGDRIGSEGVKPLSNGNFVVSSPDFDNGTVSNAGAVTFIDGQNGLTGFVSATNSLVGAHADDKVGYTGIVVLPNGNYVVGSPYWNGSRGAVTFANGNTGIAGGISAASSLVGMNPNEFGGSVRILENGNYVVINHLWNSRRGAITLGNGTTGIAGEISASNSLVGSNPGDLVGIGNNTMGIFTLPGGDFIVSSPIWNAERGAATYVDGQRGLTGPVTPENSLVGVSVADFVGSGYSNLEQPRPGAVGFADGSYAVFTPRFDNSGLIDSGAVTLGRRTDPVTGELTAANSVRGTVTDWGNLMVFDYNIRNRQFIVGQPGAKTVTIFSFEVAGTSTTPFDYDGDRKTDLSVFRPSTGTWYLQRSRDGFSVVQFGLAADKIVPADYDGDGKADVAVFRPSEGIWYIMNSSTGVMSYQPFGTTGDLPAPADFDGDGKTDIAVFRPSNGTWYRLNSYNGQFNAMQFGVSGDRPAIGDFDGDGKSDIALFRPATGTWYGIKSSDGSNFGEQFGVSTDMIVPGDYDGDGRTDLAIYRPSTGSWHIKNSQTLNHSAFQFGLSADIPLAGDFDGDGKSDVSVFRPSNGNWYRQNSSNGALFQFPFGVGGDMPTPSAFGNR